MTEREQRHAAVVAAYESACMASANAADLWKNYRAAAHAFARDYPYDQAPQPITNESAR